MIGGAFHIDGASNWHYYLGKYEVSKGQFAAVMGKGDIKKGIARLIELSGDKEDEKLIRKSDDDLNLALAFPVTSIGWLDLQTFIHAYNAWCFADTTCKAAMPQIKAKDGDSETGYGFLRLPTELEWEYAARGGLDRRFFENSLPFDREDSKKFAFVKPVAKSSTQRIGTLSPTLGGLYDLFGNLQELTADLFQADQGQGKSGAMTVRGGSYFTSQNDISSAWRNELPWYQVKPSSGEVLESRHPATGIRLVIAAPVVPTKKYLEQIEGEYTKYAKEYRTDTPVVGGASTRMI
ncbi:MAG: formylglycine-generating enzyme family protein [Candidatus Competibacteraceae bacterium]|nr:formylglycine-generating enzyme family protein [Candidatus Competibacteraceae bacterium]